MTKCAVFTISNLKSVKNYKCPRVVLSWKLVYSVISKLILYFPYFFRIQCTILSTVFFHSALSMFPFLIYWLHLKAGAAQSSYWSLLCKRSTIGQLNLFVVEWFFDKVGDLGTVTLRKMRSIIHFQRISLGFAIFQYFCHFPERISVNRF